MEGGKEGGREGEGGGEVEGGIVLQEPLLLTPASQSLSPTSVVAMVANSLY